MEAKDFIADLVARGMTQQQIADATQFADIETAGGLLSGNSLRLFDKG